MNLGVIVLNSSEAVAIKLVPESAMKWMASRPVAQDGKFQPTWSEKIPEIVLKDLHTIGVNLAGYTDEFEVQLHSLENDRAIALPGLDMDIPSIVSFSAQEHSFGNADVTIQYVGELYSLSKESI